MKNYICKMIVVFMVFILFLQLSSTVCAATPTDQVDVTPADQVVQEDVPTNRASLLFPEIYDNGGISLYLIHSLTANGVGSSLLLNSTKTITKGSLPSDAKRIYITGLLTHSGFGNGTQNVIRTGLCYYDEDNRIYIPAYYEQVPSTTNFTEILCSVSSLNAQVTYYPYIKNLEPNYGRVSGNVGFYYSKVY